MNEQLWAGVAAFLGVMGILGGVAVKIFGKRKNGNVQGSPECSGHNERTAKNSERITKVEEKVTAVEASATRIEMKQETMRVEQREDNHGLHGKLDGLTKLLIDIKNSGNGHG